MKTNNFKQGYIYHIFNKSIANFEIFIDSTSQRFIYCLDYYNKKQVWTSYSNYIAKYKTYKYINILFSRDNCLVKYLSYCIMPDHYHILIKVLEEKSISKYMSDVENSFTRYFNLKFHRKGPLWQSRFKSVLIKSDEQLLHVTRYIHLNPTTSCLVKKPEDWLFSSYKDYIFNHQLLKNHIHEISISNPVAYQKFTENNVNYQRKLKIIKRLLLDE